MPLEKKEKHTLPQRLRILILGKDKPNRVTRMSVGLGFLIWIYLVSWQILTLMVLLLLKSLEQAELLEGAFSRLGSKLYYYTNTLDRLTLHTIVELAAYGIVLFALILIYRKKRLGFLIYIIGNVTVVAATFLILGIKYFQYEMSYTYVVLLSTTTLYFSIGALWFYKWKPGIKTEAKSENSFSEQG
jgi:hypothetical protein